MRKTLLASATAAAMLAAGAVSAQSISHDVQMEVTVETSCAFTMGETQINAQIDGFSVQDGYLTTSAVAHASGSMTVACNLGVPYAIETSAGPNGLLSLVGQNTGSTIPARLTQDISRTIPFGSIANGEEIAGVGTGDAEFYNYSVSFNDDGTESHKLVPEVDTYSTVVSHTVNFAL